MRIFKRLFAGLFAALRSIFVRPIAYAVSEWNRISARERRLLSLLASAFALCAVLLVSYLVWDSYQSMSQANEDMRAAIDDISKHSDEYREAKDKVKALQARIGSDPPQLAADLEAAAKAAGIQIPETSDRPDAPAGKQYVEHSLDVKLRKVDLKSLTTFLQKVETGRALILVTRLDIRRSFGGDGTTVDVDLTATTYERLKDGKKPPAKVAVGKGKG